MIVVWFLAHSMSCSPVLDQATAQFFAGQLTVPHEIVEKGDWRFDSCVAKNGPAAFGRVQGNPQQPRE